MNVLAVDDQINVLNGLMVGVQWKKLGIDQVYVKQVMRLR